MISLLNYTAPLPLMTFTSVQNTLGDAYDCTKKKISSLVESVTAITGSTKFKLAIASIEGIGNVISIAKFSYETLDKDSKRYNASVVFKYLQTGFEVITSVFSVVEVCNLYFKTMENIKERADANISGDANKIWLADLKAVALTSEFLKSPLAILGFITLCGVILPAVVVTAAAVIAAVGALFLSSNTLMTWNSYTETSNLLDELKLERHRVFLNMHYTALIDNLDDGEEKAKLTALRDRASTVSLAETTAAKKEIKRGIEGNNDKKVIYDECLKASNKHFITLLNAKIENNPKLVKDHFCVETPKEDDDEIELSTYKGGIWKNSKEKNIFQKLVSPEVQSDETKLKNAVKCLKMRLEDKLLVDQGDMTLGTFGLVSAGLGIVLACGVFPLLASIAVTVGLILLVPKVALLVEEEYFRKPGFIAAMERITASPEIETDDDSEEDSIDLDQ